VLIAQRSRIRVLIVEDYEIIRTGLRFLLEQAEDIQVVGEARGGADALEQCAFLCPDVVVIDYTLADFDGAETARRIQRQFPGIQTIVMTCMFDSECMQLIFDAGAVGYLTKSVSQDYLLAAIRAASVGQMVLSPEAARHVVQGTRPAAALTPREREILRLIVRGCTNNEIAFQLDVSRFTVKNHVRNLLTKLGVSSRTEAAALAVQQQLVQMD
jgi:DNA-binding NarL/FixJ family response regulator